MTDRREVWTRLAFFTAVTYAVASIFMYIVIREGDIRAYGGLCAVGGMWSPFVAVLATRLILGGEHGRTLRGLGWRWGKTRWQVWSYVLPVLYVGAAHVLVWVTGQGGFVDVAPARLATWLLQSLGIGTLLGSFMALGEEIGWSGFFVPTLNKVMGFTGTAFTRGIVWSVWHYPMIVAGVYGTSATPLWYRLICFTVVLTGVSFAFAWLRIRSGSLWTGMFLHATHNMFIQEIFPGMTTDNGSLDYLVDEFGAFSAAAAIIVAVVFWWKRRELPGQDEPRPA